MNSDAKSKALHCYQITVFGDLIKKYIKRVKFGYLMMIIIKLQRFLLHEPNSATSTPRSIPSC